jgi:Domain of unknown function (DUF5671)
MTGTEPITGVPGGALGTVRRIVVLVLLFGMVVIATIGVEGLIERLIEGTRPSVVTADAAGLARSLAFTFIAGPLAAVLWWFLWRSLRSAGERSSVAWALYVAGMSTVALITFASAALGTASELVAGDWEPSGVAVALSWAPVWVWHRWMWSHPARSPLRLREVRVVLGWVFGLLIAVVGSVTALGAVFDAAIAALTGSRVVGQPWSVSALQAAVFAVGGTLIWWWHWVAERGDRGRTVLARLAMILTTSLLALVLAAGGAGLTLFVLLRLVFDTSAPLVRVVDPLSDAIAAALVGAFVGVYYRSVLRERPQSTWEAAQLVASGIALAGAASGIGVLVNALLARLGSALVESDPLVLLLGGLSALLVGAPLWWLFWRPLHPTEPATPGRRVYLVVIFGASAAVALVTLIVLAYRLFESALGVVSAAGLIDRIRAPLGLLVATVLVAAYHFAVWRHERGAAPPREARLRHVFLVRGDGDPALARELAATLEVTVTELRRADGVAGTAGPEPVAQALAGVTAESVLVLLGPGDRVDAIPLA